MCASISVASSLEGRQHARPVILCNNGNILTVNTIVIVIRIVILLLLLLYFGLASTPSG